MSAQHVRRFLFLAPLTLRALLPRRLPETERRPQLRMSQSSVASFTGRLLWLCAVNERWLMPPLLQTSGVLFPTSGYPLPPSWTHKKKPTCKEVFRATTKYRLA